MQIINDKLDFASVDVSFISLSKILPAAYDIISEKAEMVCLIKPQFEAGKENVGKKGVVRDAAVQEDVISRVMTMAVNLGFKVKGLDYSPVKGNIEFLLYLTKEAVENAAPDIFEIVKAAHDGLDGGM